MISSVKFVLVLLFSATCLPAFAQQLQNSRAARPLCYTTSSVTCEWLYLNDPNLILSMTQCGECGNGPNGDECTTVDQFVYHLDASESALVDPWAVPTTSGKSNQVFDNTSVKCGTKNYCKWKCVKDDNDVYQCVESTLTFDWNFPTSTAGGQNCP